uniref:HTH OST-type domain-containing protein n=1 Tax=Meloidogyne hapla TaxID=6305 RepID=A0A1I8BFJ1_MELHA
MSSISKNSFTLSSITTTSNGSNTSLNSSNNSFDLNDINDPLKLLTNKLSKFRDQISQTLLSTPQGFSSLGAFIADFNFFYGFNPSERARSFGYFSLYEFLKSDYMKGRVCFKICVNGELYLFPLADENTRNLFNQILISYEERNQRKKR